MRMPVRFRRRSMGISIEYMRMKCKHYHDGTCGIASGMAGESVRPDANACKYCTESEQPQQRNLLTLGIARHQIQHTNPELAARLLVEMRPFMQVIRTGANQEGPGTELKKLLSWFHSPEKRKCKCQTRIQKMNAWGPDKCEQKIETILRWMRHSAKIHKIPFFEPAVRLVIRTAIKRSRSPLRQHPEKTALSPIVLHQLKPVDGPQ